MAIVSILFLAGWFASLVLLHFLKPDFTPNNHTCSEYANGRFGWLMEGAFFSMAVAQGIQAVLFWKSQTVISLLFVLVALSFIGLGVWRADITISEDPETTEGKWHLLAGFSATLFIDVLVVLLVMEPSGFLFKFVSFLCVASHVGFIISMNSRKIPIFGIAQRNYMFWMSFWLLLVALKFV